MRAGSQPYLGPDQGWSLGGAMMGGGAIPLGKRCGRSYYRGRPRERGGRSGRRAGHGAPGYEWAGVRQPGDRGQCLLAELAEEVIAALEQLARDRQTRPVASEPFGSLGVVLVAWAVRTRSSV